MEEQRIVKIFFRLEGWKRNKKKALALCFLVFVVLASGFEEGDDNVNVISVENLDALLGLRMVTELNLKNLSATAERSRRGARQADSLCENKGCDCESWKRSVSCHFRAGEEALDLGYGSISSHVHHLTISNLTELRILPGAFTHNLNLLSLTLKDISNITVGKDVFPSLTNRPHFNLGVFNCNALTIHDHSFINVGSPFRVAIEDCGYVRMKKSVFPPTLWLRMNRVSNLEMNSYTFYAERMIATKATADMGFFHVNVKIIPSWTFKLSGAKITFFHSVIETIDKEAFRALQLESVHFRNTTIGRLESEAFSEQTSVKDIELDATCITYVGEQALTAATNLTIRNSSLEEISGGAFNMSAAFLKLTRNRFRKIGRHAFSIKSWNSIVIDSNEFKLLNQDAFATPFSKVENVTNEFVFSGNIVVRTEVNALSFVPNDPELEVLIKNNTFHEPCHCHLESWMLTLSTRKWDSFYDTSNCKISEFGLCYNLEGDFMSMRNYTEAVCGTPANPECETIKVGDYGFPTELDFKNTERTILGVIFLGVASSIAIMLFILSFSWMRDKGVCSAFGRYLKPSRRCCFAVSKLCNSSNLVTTSSISRINIHEYAEIQYQMTEQQKQTILNGGIDEGEEEEEEMVVICEDKATQTLPEELTQELLQSLREKLDDPENYNEARYMIEHLYDLIKVEESCNNNNMSRTSLLLDDDEEDDVDVVAGDNIYDVIDKKPGKRSKRVRKSHPSNNMTSTGTRAPSPDKLSPIAFNLPRTTVVTDYAEPRDRKSNEYCELPGSRDSVMPDVLAVPGKKPHLYALPFKRMENRPLPSKPSTSESTS